MAGSATDAGPADTHSYAWQVFDAGNALVASGTGTNVRFTPVSSGTHTVRLTATDDDGGTGSIDVPVVVNTHWLDPDGLLRVGGTSGSDDIELSPNSSGVRIFFGGVSAGAALAATKVLVRAGAGADDVTVASGLPPRTSVFGGAGNDLIRSGNAGDALDGEDCNDTVIGGGGADVLDGGLGHDVLVGGDGNDLITGGKNDDLIIGGRGADSLDGDSNDDVLVAGWTSYDQDLARLDQILDAWRSRTGYAAGVTAIRQAGLVDDVAVFDDGARDVMTGDAGLDVFYGNLNRPGTLDVITDEKPKEIVFELG